MMVRPKRIHILMIKINEEFNSFASWRFLKDIENMFFVFLSSDRNTREVGRTRKSCGNTRPSARVPTAFLVLPNFHSCFYNRTERFHSRDQRLYWFIKTKDDSCVQIEFYSRGNGLTHQYGRRFFVLEHQYGCRLARNNCRF